MRWRCLRRLHAPQDRSRGPNVDTDDVGSCTAAPPAPRLRRSGYARSRTAPQTLRRSLATVLLHQTDRHLMLATALLLLASPIQTLGPGLIDIEPFPCPGVPVTETWACDASAVYQGVCALDHSGRDADAGGDWDGDGHPDVILGGVDKNDIQEQEVRPDDNPNPVTIYLRRTFTTPITGTSPGGTDTGDRAIQFPIVRLYGTQTSSASGLLSDA